MTSGALSSKHSTLVLPVRYPVTHNALLSLCNAPIRGEVFNVAVDLITTCSSIALCIVVGITRAYYRRKNISPAGLNFQAPLII